MREHTHTNTKTVRALTCIYVYIYTNIYTNPRVVQKIYINIYVRTHIYIYIYIYISAQIRICEGRSKSSRPHPERRLLVGWLFCFTAYQPFSGHLTPN